MKIEPQLHPRLETHRKFLFVKWAILILTCAILISGWYWIDAETFGLPRQFLGRYRPWFFWPASVSGSIVAVAYTYRTILWLTYRPVTAYSISNHEWPTVTVVVPAYNEGSMVQKAMLSAIESDYPADKLHLICVDDGSCDDTYNYMKNIENRFPERVSTVQFSSNRGKRHAVHNGIRQAQSEIIVTLDSDSVLEPQSLKNLVAPLVLNPDVGAVAGCVLVYNRHDNLITRMLGVRYILGFDFTRAYQSVLRTVLVCPGALSAYRRDVISPHLDGWLQQQFLGKDCTNGDDHALTNVVLRNHRGTCYQSNARALTVVPNTYPALSRMYIRWARSNIRESWFYTHFSLSRATRRREWLAFLDGWIHALQIPIQIYLTLIAIAVVIAYPSFLLRSLVFATLFSLVYVVYYLRSERSTEFIFGILYAWFSVLTLQWIYPWAAITVGSNQWLTRNVRGRLATSRRR